MGSKMNHYHRNMQDKELAQVLDTEDFQAFMLRKKDYDGRMGSTMVIFSPEGIIITGDLCPGYTHGNGIVSVLGYGLRWFSGNKHSGSYLCEKFLRQGWQEEIAVEELKGWLEDGGNPYGDKDEPLPPERLEKLQELIDYLEGGDANQHQFYDDLLEIYDPTVYGKRDPSVWRCPDILTDGAPGWGYDPTDAGWLIAIQHRFVELYEEMKANEVPEEEDQGEGGRGEGQ